MYTEERTNIVRHAINRLRPIIMIGFGVLLALIMAIIVVANYGNSVQANANDYVIQTYKRKSLLNQIEGQLFRAESEERGFVLTEKDLYLKSYEDTISALNQSIIMLRKLERPELGAQSALREFDSLVQMKIDSTNRVISLTKDKKMPEAMQIIQSGQGKALMERGRLIRASMSEQEDQILQQQLQEVISARQTVLTIFISGVLAAACMTTIIVYIINVVVAGRIRREITAFSTSSSEISAAITEHERVVGQQAIAVAQTTSTMEELSVSAMQSSHQAESASNSAREAQNLTGTGLQMATQTEAGMVRIKEKVNAAADQILRLSEQAGQIGAIANLVSDLASQTNMLALNAAVEAARAGDQGKGFAVVAAEIRQLADQSKKSAERANSLVIDIQKATNAAVMVTEAGTTTVDEVALIAQKTGQTFNELSGIATAVYENAQQVMLNGQEQVRSIKQVAEAMRSLSNGSAEMASSTGQTKLAMQRLAVVAQTIEAML